MCNLFQIVLIGLVVLGAQADEVVVKEIIPSKVESAWLEIDWKADLWGARKEAARTGKPITRAIPWLMAVKGTGLCDPDEVITHEIDRAT